MIIELGSKVKDKVSGFEGITVARTMWLNGCARITVQPPVDKDGKLPDSICVDEFQLELVQAGVVTTGRPDTGGPLPFVPRPPPNPSP